MTEAFNAVAAAGLNPAKFDEHLMTAVAHEVTHLLFEKTDAGAFDKNERTKDANQNGVADEAEDQTCLMYNGTGRPNSEVATVRFFPVVQTELHVRKNQSLVIDSNG
ncbi:MAG: hypothetical protein K2V38_24195 [Gemmataceae bacterium]|nr:hypothetical protein [Gemmataceae bacterium]